MRHSYHERQPIREYMVIQSLFAIVTIFIIFTWNRKTPRLILSLVCDNMNITPGNEAPRKPSQPVYMKKTKQSRNRSLFASARAQAAHIPFLKSSDAAAHPIRHQLGGVRADGVLGGGRGQQGAGNWLRGQNAGLFLLGHDALVRRGSITCASGRWEDLLEALRGGDSLDGLEVLERKRV